MKNKINYLLILRVMLLCILSLYFSNLSIASDYQFKQAIFGLTPKPKENALLRLNQLAKEQKPLDPNKIQQLYQNAPTQILQALQPYGYFRATIIKTYLTHNNKNYLAEYSVNPGKPLLITHLTIQVIGAGANDPSIQAYLNSVPLKIGQVLRTQRYLNVKQAFINTAQLSGYLSANFSKSIIAISLKNYTADITLIFNTGPRYYFGLTTFSPNPYSTRFLNRYLPYKPGDPFSNSLILQLQNALTSSVYFNSVTINANVANAVNNVVPVNITLVPKPPKKYSFGIGYGTDTGVRGSLGWEWRRVTASGDYMQAVIQASQIQNAFQAKYVIPGENPALQHYEIVGGVNTNQPGTGQYTTYQTGVNYINNIGSWTQTYSLTYQHERFNVDNVSPTILTQYIVPSFTLQKIQADNQVNTRNGYRITFIVSGGKGLNVNSDFVQGEMQAKLIRTFWQNNRIILRTDIGATAVQNSEDFPLSLRFFAGGTQSVRGYAYQSLGPGEYLAVGSAEYQRRIHGKWYLATFYDAGNAFDTPETSPTNLQEAAGIGIVYQSPLGPLELTLAKPLNTGNNNFSTLQRGLRVQFSIGPDL